MDAILINLEEEVCFSLLRYTSQPVPGKCGVLACYVKDVLQDVALYVCEIQGGRSRGSHCASTDRCVYLPSILYQLEGLWPFLLGIGIRGGNKVDSSGKSVLKSFGAKGLWWQLRPYEQRVTSGLTSSRKPIAQA